MLQHKVQYHQTFSVFFLSDSEDVYDDLTSTAANQPPPSPLPHKAKRSNADSLPRRRPCSNQLRISQEFSSEQLDRQEPPAPPQQLKSGDEIKGLAESRLAIKCAAGTLLQQRRSLIQRSCESQVSPDTTYYHPVMTHAYYPRAESDQERSESPKARGTRWDVFNDEAMLEEQGAQPSVKRPLSKMMEKSLRQTLDIAAGGPEKLVSEEEAVLDLREKKTKKKGSLEQGIISRFESEIDFLQRQLEFQVGGKSGLMDYTADAKGQVPAIREAESNRTIDQWLQPDVLKTLLMLPDKVTSALMMMRRMP